MRHATSRHRRAQQVQPALVRRHATATPTRVALALRSLRHDGIDVGSAYRPRTLLDCRSLCSVQCSCCVRSFQLSGSSLFPVRGRKRDAGQASLSDGRCACQLAKLSRTARFGQSAAQRRRQASWDSAGSAPVSPPGPGRLCSQKRCCSCSIPPVLHHLQGIWADGVSVMYYYWALSVQFALSEAGWLV